MKKLFSLAVVGAVFGLAGCKEGTSVAPATTPNGGTVAKTPGTTTVPATDGSGTTKPADPNSREKRRELTVKSPGSQTVTQDGTDELTVSIDRDNFAGPVVVELRDLPRGVSVVTKELTIPEGKDSITVTVKAAPDAAPVDGHKTLAVAKAKDMPEAKVDFTYTVKAK